MFIRNLVPSLKHLVYPPCCAACDQTLHSPDGFCSLCAESAEPILCACPSCALPISGPAAIQCAACLRRPLGLNSCTAAFEYGGQLRVALMRLKYGRRSDVARSLAPLLLPSFAAAATRADLVLAVPLHRSRLRRRRFNQCQRLLAPLARAADIPTSSTAIWRTRATPPQAGLEARARRENLRGAFRARSDLRGVRVLLLDDVMTTGETMRSLARTLRQVGATEVHGYVVARAEGRHSC